MGDATLSDYYITDIMAVAQNVDSKESSALAAALDQSIAYTRSTTGDSHLSGISVTLPYGDPCFYEVLQTAFLNCGMDETYAAWLEKFTTTVNFDDFYDYSAWNQKWDGWDEYDDDFDWSTWDYYDDDEYWEEFDDRSEWSDYMEYDESWNSWIDEYYDSVFDEESEGEYASQALGLGMIATTMIVGNTIRATTTTAGRTTTIPLTRITTITAGKFLGATARANDRRKHYE